MIEFAFLVLLAAALSAGTAFIANKYRPRSSIRSRAAWSAVIGSALPMSPVLLVVLIEGVELLVLGALLFMLVSIGILICFPVGYLVARKQDEPDDPGVFS